MCAGRFIFVAFLLVCVCAVVCVPFLFVWLGPWFKFVCLFVVVLCCLCLLAWFALFASLFCMSCYVAVCCCVYGVVLCMRACLLVCLLVCVCVCVFVCACFVMSFFFLSFSASVLPFVVSFLLSAFISFFQFVFSSWLKLDIVCLAWLYSFFGSFVGWLCRVVFVQFQVVRWQVAFMQQFDWPSIVSLVSAWENRRLVTCGKWQGLSSEHVSKRGASANQHENRNSSIRGILVVTRSQKDRPGRLQEPTGPSSLLDELSFPNCLEEFILR